MGLVKPKEQMKKVNLNLGMGEVGGGSQLRPEAKSLVKAEAMALAGGLGGAGVAGICCPRRCLKGDPTHNLTNRANSSTSARPSLELTLNKGLICLI